MNVLDANLLIALFRDDHAHHEAALRWWAQSSDQGESFTVPDLVWLAFTRIATDRRIFPHPATFDEAWAFARSLMAQPTYLEFASDARTLSRFVALARESAATSALTNDAYIAATASTFGGTVVTFDRDFRRFDGVRVTELTG